MDPLPPPLAFLLLLFSGWVNRLQQADSTSPTTSVAVWR
jgi:hypothetical protein